MLTSSLIKDIAVATDERGHGIGTALLTAALETFARRGAAFVDLKTDVDNVAAQAVYRRLGFVTIARID